MLKAVILAQGCIWPTAILLKAIFGLRVLAHGGLAQLGERLAGSQKVIGSSPLSSTVCNFLGVRDLA